MKTRSRAAEPSSDHTNRRNPCPSERGKAVDEANPERPSGSETTQPGETQSNGDEKASAYPSDSEPVKSGGSESARPRLSRKAKMISERKDVGGGGRDKRKTTQKSWEEKIEALREFKRVHSHTNVPKNESCRPLGRFVNNLRQFYRKRMKGEKNCLTDERIRALEEIGFVWSMKPISENRARNLQSQWKLRLKQLEDYKRIHGHCNVSMRGNGELGKFVMNQRYYYKAGLEGQKNSLTPERIRDLEKLGFVWTLKGKRVGGDGKFLKNEEKWERNIEELRKFKQKFGHVNVSKTADYKDLGQFVGNQRYFYRRRLKGESSSLSDERIKVLNDLGFEWKARRWTNTKCEISSKARPGSQVTEKDKEISLLDGSTIDSATKESMKKCLVFLEGGSLAMETITETYTTQIERQAIPLEEEKERHAPSDRIPEIDVKPPSLPGAVDAFKSKQNVTLPDGSSIDCTVKKSWKKRLVVLPDGTQLLETTQTTHTVKVEKRCMPPEEADSFSH